MSEIRSHQHLQALDFCSVFSASVENSNQKKKGYYARNVINSIWKSNEIKRIFRR